MKPMATRNKPQRPEPPEAWWETCLAGIFLALTLVGMIAVLIVLDQAWNEPQERCFDTAVSETNYCREQHTWE